jgi:hypothetical protein
VIESEDLIITIVILLVCRISPAEFGAIYEIAAKVEFGVIYEIAIAT